jgi:hypothetical protein
MSTGPCRFFSTASAITSVLALEDVATRLPRLSGKQSNSTDLLDIGPADRPNGAIRSSRYMLLRALVPGLAFRDKNRAASQHEQVSSDGLEQVRSLVDMSLEVFANGAPSSDELKQLFVSLFKLLGIFSIDTLWIRNATMRQEFLYKKLGALSGYSKAAGVVNANKETVSKLNSSRFALVSSSITKQHVLLRQMSMKLHPGLGRWLLLGNDRLARDSAVRDRFKLARDEARDLGLSEAFGTLEWRTLVLQRELSAASQLTVCGLLFCHGDYSTLSTHLQQIVASRTILQNADLALCAAVMYWSVRVSLATGDELQEMHNVLDTSVANVEAEFYEDSDSRFSEADRERRSFCAHGLLGWLTAYRCMSLAKSIHSSNAYAMAREQALRSIESIQALAAKVSVELRRDMQVEAVLLLLSIHVPESRIQVDCERAIQSDDVYAVDAAALRLLSEGRLRREVAEVVLSRMQHLKYVGCEPFLIEHMSLFGQIE